MKCTTDSGGSGWKYGDSGKCYKNRKDALSQMRAIKFQQSRGVIDFSNEGLTNDELLGLSLDLEIARTEKHELPKE